MAVVAYKPGHYHSYAEMCALMGMWAEKYPQYSGLESIGQTLDGKDLLLLSITDHSTGPHSSKPAFWCDGNTHAGEVTGTECCLHMTNEIFERLDAEDPQMMELMATSTVYVLPRISADGAEYVMTTPYSCRSSPVLLDPDHMPPGFVEDDVDGNNLCVTMRQKDPSGGTKVSELDSRIMVQRSPEERDSEGEFYRLYPEGTFRDYDGFTKKTAPAYSIDLNRHSPYEWKPEGGQAGAGPYPMYLPQGRAVYEALVKRNNIATLQSYHTSGAMVLHNGPSVTGSDHPTFDALAKMGTQLTGYAQVFGHFYQGPVDMSPGGECAWAYQHRGIWGFSNECWNLMEHVRPLLHPVYYLVLKETTGEEYDHSNDLGIKGAPAMDAIGTREKDYLQMYSWLDENYPGEYIKEWEPFNHPQLGPVEIGGINSKWCQQNPPPNLLAAECEKNTAFALALVAVLPVVTVSAATSTPIGGGASKVAISYINTGFLPTNGTDMAIKTKSIRPKALVSITRTDGIEFVTGSSMMEIDHLSGRSSSYTPTAPVARGGSANNPHEGRVELVLTGRGEVVIEVDWQRGGVTTVTVAVDPDDVDAKL